LNFIHQNKTGALIRASLTSGALLAGANQKQLRALDTYGRCIGLLFQITDDILDVTADKHKLGKRGSDRANQKLTYVSLYGLEKAHSHAIGLVVRARRALKIFGRDSKILDSLAAFILSRDH
jgi:geranylgeranyl diphosphate synthase type II